MATLEEQRRALGDAMIAARNVDLAGQRKAIGKRLIEERTGKAVVDDLNSLINQGRAPRRTLRQPQPVGTLPASRGRGNYTPAAPASEGGGIASPLTEKLDEHGQPDREYWPSGLKSSDGLFIIPAIKTLNLLDANGAAVKIELADPEGTV